MAHLLTFVCSGKLYIHCVRGCVRDSKENIRRLGLITFMSYSCLDKKTSLHQIQLNLYVDKFSSNRGKTFFWRDWAHALVYGSGYKFISVACEHRRISRGTQGEILRKRPKNNNKAWIRLSEAILSILGDYWEKFICSSYSRSKTDGRVPNKEVAPTTCNLTNVRRVRRAKLRPSVEGGEGVEKWVWSKGEIHPFRVGWGGGKGEKALLTNST